MAAGAEWVLDGDSVRIDTAVALPSGKLTLAAQRGLVLGDGARLDLAGRKTDFHDVSKYGWGGELRLESRQGTFCRRRAASSTCPPATTAPAA